MLWTIIVILIVLWLLGFLALFILGESIAPTTNAGIALIAAGSAISFIGARKSHS